VRRVIFAIALAGAVAMVTGQSAKAADELKIGFLATLSGPGGLYGQALRDGFMLAVEEAGGRLGGLPTEISINDAQFKPDVGKQIAEKLIVRDKVDIITGTMYTNVLMAIYNTVVDSKTILISQSSGPSLIAGKMCSPYFFTTSEQLDQLSAATGQYVQSTGVKRVFVVASNFQAGQDMVNGFKSKYHGTIVNEIYPAIAQQDYSAEITQIAAAKPEAVYVFIAGSPAINFVKQYAEAGLMKQIPLYNTNMIGAATLPAIGDIALGARSAAHWTLDMDNPANKHFVAAFRKKYNAIPSVYSSQGYDAARMIDAAVRQIKGKVEDREALIKALSDAKYDSVRGPYKYNNNHFPIQKFYATEIVKDKDGTLIEANRGVILEDEQDAYHQDCPLK